MSTVHWLCAVVLSVCAACHTPVLRHYDGLPPDASAITYCDANGDVRSALEANLFRVLPDGTVAANPTLPEILVHETVHRVQLERRAREGLCHKPLTWPQLLGMEVEAYCAGFAVALASGRDSVEVGDRYARALVHQFRLLGHARHAVERAWAKGCPHYGLAWSPA